MVFAIQVHESAIGIYVYPHSEPLCHLPVFPIPLWFPRALASGALLH